MSASRHVRRHTLSIAYIISQEAEMSVSVMFIIGILVSLFITLSLLPLMYTEAEMDSLVHTSD